MKLRPVSESVKRGLDGPKGLESPFFTSLDHQGMNIKIDIRIQTYTSAHISSLVTDYSINLV